MPYKILIVDDHALVREGLTALVSTLPGGAITFTAETAAQALELAEIHAPLDAVLLDCGLPDANGINLITALQGRGGSVPIIIVSADETDGVVNRAMALGASAFISKRKSPSSILTALKLALAHGIPNVGVTDSADAQFTSPILTARQLDILLMLDQGLTNNNIALQLGLAEKTVKNHITGLFDALGATSRLQAIRQARNLGLLT